MTTYKRYFTVFYAVHKYITTFDHLNIITDGNYPNLTKILEQIKTERLQSPVNITNIIEYKERLDYEDFIA
jgi:hypothetical protein